METVPPAVTTLAAFFFYASLKATVIIVLVILLQKLFGRLLSANARYLLWLPVVISLVTPVGFDIELPWASVGGEVSAANQLTMRINSDATEPRSTDREDQFASRLGTLPLTVSPSAPGDAASQAPSFPWLLLFSYLWITGGFIVLGVIGVSSYCFAQLVRQATPAPEHLQHFLQVCMTEASCRQRVRLLLSADIQEPMVAGLFKPVLLLPKGLEQRLTAQQLRHVVIHELMHLQRFDIVSNWIGALLQALHWFNPAVWLAFSLIRQDRELACDAATLVHLGPADRAAYGHTLLQLGAALPHDTLPTMSLGILDGPSELRRRILMLVQTSHAGRLQTTLASMLLALLCAAACGQPVLTTKAAELPASAPTPPVAVAPPASPLIGTLPGPAQPATAQSLPAPAAPLAPEEIPPVVEELPASEVPAAAEPVVAERALAQADVIAPGETLAPAPDEPLLVAADAPAEEPPSVEFLEEISALEELGEDITAVQAEKIRYVSEWDAIAAACNARPGRFFGNRSKACRQVRVALTRGEIFEFGFECFQLLGRQQQLVNTFGVDARSTLPMVAATLAENEQHLNTFCSKATYENDYPAFATLMAQAESLAYYDPAGDGDKRTPDQMRTRLLPTYGFHETDHYLPVNITPQPLEVVPATIYESQSTPVFIAP